MPKVSLERDGIGRLGKKRFRFRRFRRCSSVQVGGTRLEWYPIKNEECTSFKGSQGPNTAWYHL